MASNATTSVAIDFPPLPSTWDIINSNDSNERNIKSIPLSFDSDSDSDTEAWETLEYESTPAPYRDVALSGSVHAELEKVSEAFISSPQLSSSLPSSLSPALSAKPGKERSSGQISSAPSTPDLSLASDDIETDEYEAYKSPRARAMNKTHHANIRVAHLHSVMSKEKIGFIAPTDEEPPVWERLKDPSKVERRKQFELTKKNRKNMKVPFAIDKRKGGGFRNEGKTDTLVW
jgi:hypothetical protein